MPQTPAEIPLAPQELPESFFSELANTPLPPRDPRFMVHHSQTGDWRAKRFLPWHDAIIDQLLAEPTIKAAEIAHKLGRAANTVALICRSDLFKARYAQRRDAYNAAIQQRLTGKLVQVAEAALTHTLTALERKKDQVPLAMLNEITNRALDRLGYAPQQASNPTVAVQVNNTVGAAQVSVSSEDLASAREKLRIVESRNAVRQPAEAPQRLSEDGGDEPQGSGALIEGSNVGAL